MRSPTLVVMAAGLGSRYGGIKQIDPVGPGGEILLDYAVYDAIRSGFDRVIFVIREEIEEPFRARIEPTIARRCRVEYAYQRIDDVPDGCRVPESREKPWGTGHAPLAAEPLLDGPFALINADDFYGSSSFRTMYRFLSELPESPAGLEMALIGYELRNTLTEHGHVSRGVCQTAADGTLTGIRECERIQRFGDAIRYVDTSDRWHDIDPETVVSMNLWGFPHEVLGEMRNRFEAFLRAPETDLESAEFYLPDVISELVRDGVGTVRVLATSEEWFGVTYPEDRPWIERRIRELVSQGVYPERLWSAADSS